MPGVETRCSVSDRMSRRKTEIGRNATGVGAGNCTGKVVRSRRSVRWKWADNERLASQGVTACAS